MGDAERDVHRNEIMKAITANRHLHQESLRGRGTADSSAFGPAARFARPPRVPRSDWPWRTTNGQGPPGPTPGAEMPGVIWSHSESAVIIRRLGRSRHGRADGASGAAMCIGQRAASGRAEAIPHIRRSRRRASAASAPGPPGRCRAPPRNSTGRRKGRGLRKWPARPTRPREPAPRRSK